MLQNIICFIVYIVIIARQCIVFLFLALELRFERLNDLPCNALKPKFAAIFFLCFFFFFFFVTAVSFMEIISS